MSKVLKRVAILGVSLVSLAGLWAFQSRPLDRKPVVDRPTEKSVDLSLRCRSTLSDRYSFRYTSESRFSRQMIGASSGANEETLDVSLQGNWSQRCASVSSGLRTVAFDFSGVQGHVRGSSPGFDSTEAPGELFSGLGFSKISSHGEVKSIYFPKDMKILGQHLLRDVLSLRSFRLPTEASVGQTWEREEKDLLGIYRAQYQLVSAKDGIAKVKKRRLNYEGATPQDQGMDAQLAEDNKTMISIDLASGMVRSVDSSLTVTQRMDGRVVSVNKSGLSLSYSGSGSLSSQELALLERRAFGLDQPGGWVVSDTSASEVEERLERRLHEQQLAGRGWDDIRKTIESVDGFDTDTFLSAKALLVLQPELASRVLDLMVSQEDPNSATFQLASGALAAAGTPQAQAAMLEGVAQLDASPTAQNIVLGLMGQLENPTAATVSTLEEMSRNVDAGDGVANSSRLALGSLARQLDAEHRDRIVEGIRGNLGQAKTLDERVNALLSLGNTGDAKLRSEFLTRLKDPVLLVRKASCFALGQQSQSAVVEPLIYTSQHDEAAAVRVECLDALGQRALAPEHVETVLNIAVSDAVPEVRLAALRIASAHESYPDLRTVLRHVGDEDSSKDVRRFAELVLLRLDASS